MDDPIRGFTIEEFAQITRELIFEVRNCLLAIVGYSELAKKELDPSHPAFPHVAKVLQVGERAFATIGQFDREFHRRRNDAEGTKEKQS
jgi:hypothetical protein